MRTIRTFILRLLVDPAEPETLRGALQPAPEGEGLPFADEQGLLALLHRAAAGVPAPDTRGPQPGQDIPFLGQP